MEMDLKNIIEKIKEEGVGEAEKTAGGIVSQAEEKAKNILIEAEKEKEEILKKAKQEAERLKVNGEEAIRQASRDVLLGLREQIIALFDKVIKTKVNQQLSPEVLKSLITNLADKFTVEGSAGIEVLLNKKDQDSLETALMAGLKEKMAQGITIKASPNIESGFRIGEKDNNSYYDFTDEAIADAFKAFLNPKLTQILDVSIK